jgi:ribosomal protein S18 acetylase RimI-like enzyme
MDMRAAGGRNEPTADGGHHHESAPHIETLSHDQWPLLRALRLRALAQSGHLLDGAPQVEAEEPPAYWQQLLREATFWHAAVDGRPAGLVRYSRQGRVGQLGSLWVEQHDRHQDLARRLTLTAIEHSRHNGDQEIRFCVVPGNRPPLHLLRSLGAVPTGWLIPRSTPPHILRLELRLEHSL